MTPDQFFTIVNGMPLSRAQKTEILDASVEMCGSFIGSVGSDFTDHLTPPTEAEMQQDVAGWPGTTHLKKTAA